MNKTRDKGRLTSRKIQAMSDAERAKLIADIEAESPEDRLARSKPLNAEQPATWNRIKKNLGGRPMIGKGSKMVAVTIERDLLKQADAYAKKHGLKRAQLIAHGLRRVIREGVTRRSA
jgi:hypothetical protein